jgi:hypothetical protein
VDLNDFLQKGFLKAGTELIILTKTDRARLDELLKKGEIEKNRLLFSPLDFEALELLDKKFSPTGELDLKSIKKRAESLKDFDSLGETDLPREFEGELRPYQKGGYDWLHFLHDYGFHGCLADDMGLGKDHSSPLFPSETKGKGGMGPGTNTGSTRSGSGNHPGELAEGSREIYPPTQSNDTLRSFPVPFT